MQEVFEFLKKNFSGSLATVEGGKQPRVRPFLFAIEEAGKLYFATSNEKEVYKQLKANPYVEFTSSSPDPVWVRVSGEVVFSDDVKIKQKILDGNDVIKSVFQSVDNPVYVIFYIAKGTASISDFSGQPPKKFEF